MCLQNCDLPCIVAPRRALGPPDLPEVVLQTSALLLWATSAWRVLGLHRTSLDRARPARLSEVRSAPKSVIEQNLALVLWATFAWRVLGVYRTSLGRARPARFIGSADKIRHADAAQSKSTDFSRVGGAATGPCFRVQHVSIAKDSDQKALRNGSEIELRGRRYHNDAEAHVLDASGWVPGTEFGL
jgi:hypothetical protein